LFLLGVVCVVVYAIINSPSLGLVAKPLMNTTNAILIIMLSVATLTTIVCRVETDSILNSSTFKAGMSACICILGVAWLGDTFVSHNIDWIKDTAGSVIQGHPWLLAVIFFFSALLYSQAATAKALMPMALALNVSPLTAVASFAAVSGCSFCQPTQLWLRRFRWMTPVQPASVNSSLTIRSSSRVLWVWFWLSASASCWAASCCKTLLQGAFAPCSSSPPRFN
jgi:anaerobic C4-dicarboxylate transporter DcuA